MSRVVLKQSYRDVEAFERALQGVQGHYLQTKPAIREWRLCHADLDGTTLTLAQEGGPNLYQGACADDCFRALVPLSRSNHLAVNGGLLMRTCVAWLAPATEFSTRSAEATRWLAISIARQRVTRWLEQHSFDEVLAESDVAISADAGSIHHIVELMRRVLRVEAAGRAALDSRAAEGALDQELTDTVLSVVGAHRSAMPVVGRGRPRLSRQIILKRIAGLIDESVDQPIRIGDFCRAARVSSRTLHAVFIEQFGMSAHRYLMLLRLRAIHSALLRAEPTETVTDICARFGVWDHGRFAQNYRCHFGRLPSQVRSSQAAAETRAKRRCARRRTGLDPRIEPGLVERLRR